MCPQYDERGKRDLQEDVDAIDDISQRLRNMSLQDKIKDDHEADSKRLFQVSNYLYMFDLRPKRKCVSETRASL